MNPINLTPQFADNELRYVGAINALYYRQDGQRRFFEHHASFETSGRARLPHDAEGASLLVNAVETALARLLPSDWRPAWEQTLQVAFYRGERGVIAHVTGDLVFEAADGFGWRPDLSLIAAYI